MVSDDTLSPIMVPVGPFRIGSSKAAWLLAACAFAASGQTANPRTSDADRIAGAKIFRSHCASCHGRQGQGGLGPNLTTGTFFHGASDSALYRTISDGIAGTSMPSAFFDGTQLWQVVAFVRSLGASAPAAPVSGDARQGEQLFREKGCSGCHLALGEGGVRGPDLSAIGSQRSPDYLRQSITDPNAAVAPEYWVAKIVTADGASWSGFLLNQDTYMVQILDASRGLVSIPRSEFKDYGVDKDSIMPSYKTTLTAAELDDLVAYLASLKTSQEGRP